MTSTAAGRPPVSVSTGPATAAASAAAPSPPTTPSIAMLNGTRRSGDRSSSTTVPIWQTHQARYSPSATDGYGASSRPDRQVLLGDPGHPAAAAAATAAANSCGASSGVK